MIEKYLTSIADYPFDLDNLNVQVFNGVGVINGDLEFSHHVTICDIDFPDYLIINGNVTIDRMGVVSFGEHITINGSLRIYDCLDLNIKSFPKVNGDIQIFSCCISSFPDDLEVKTNIDITCCEFINGARLPSRVICNGDFTMKHCYGDNITKWIEYLRCTGIANFSGSQSIFVPRELHVSHSLILDHISDITMPSVLEVYGNLYMRNVKGFDLKIPKHYFISGYINIYGSSDITISCSINVVVSHNGNMKNGSCYPMKEKSFDDIIISYPFYGDNQLPISSHDFQSDESREELIDEIWKSVCGDGCYHYSRYACGHSITC